MSRISLTIAICRKRIAATDRSDSLKPSRFMPVFIFNHTTMGGWPAAAAHDSNQSI
jgi:hypothetical protein